MPQVLKKITVLFSIFIVFSVYSQSEMEMLNVGIKKGTVNKIFKSFNGNIYSAIDRWAVTGSGKLSKKFIRSAEKLGINNEYLWKRLKQAQRIRAQAIAAGLAGAAAGYAGAASQQKPSSPVNYTPKNSSYSNPGGYSTEGAYSNPGGYSTEGAYSNPGGSSNSNSSSTNLYQTNQYGFQEKTGEMNRNYSGGIDISKKNEYGFQEKTGELKTNYSGNTDIYEKNENGFMEKVGEYRKNSYGGYDIYRKNSNGFLEKTGSVKESP